jgi:hypothetical protein
MLDFLVFRRMLTPIIIQILFWASLVVCFIGAIYNFAHNAFFHGLQELILIPILIRVLCEILILFFRMNETLTDLKNTVQQRP